MPITIHIFYSGAPGKAAAFAREMTESGRVAAIRAEAGNLRYQYFTPLEDPNTVLLIDAWADQHALDVHHASPVMAEIAQLRDRYDLHMQVERYVTDESGEGDGDSVFLRK